MAAVRDGESKVSLLEIGTGRIAWEQDHLPPIGCVAFSSAQQFAMGTEQGLLVFSFDGEIAATAERVAAARSRSETFWQRYPIDLRAANQPRSPTEEGGGDLSPRSDLEAVPGVESRHPFVEIARFVEKVTARGEISQEEVQSAAEALHSHRSVGTVGSYGGSDGTADSIECLEALRASLDAAEDREDLRSSSPCDQDIIRDLDAFETRLQSIQNHQPNQSLPNALRQRSVQFQPLPPSNKRVGLPKKPRPADTRTPAEILIAAKQAENARPHVGTGDPTHTTQKAEQKRAPFGTGQAV